MVGGHLFQFCQTKCLDLSGIHFKGIDIQRTYKCQTCRHYAIHIDLMSSRYQTTGRAISFALFPRRYKMALYLIYRSVGDINLIFIYL